MTRREIRAMLQRARRTGTTPNVAAEDLPVLREEAGRLGVRIDVEAIDRSPNDCLRMAVAWAYEIPYDDTPALDPLARPGTQQSAWEAWAARRALRWWISNELAPVSMSRWIACVPSRTHPGCTHAVVMEFDRLAFDPMEGGELAWTHVEPADVGRAQALLPVDSPLWEQECRYWRIGRRQAAA